MMKAITWKTILKWWEKMLSYRLSGMGLKYKHADHGNYYLVTIKGTALQPVDNQVA